MLAKELKLNYKDYIADEGELPKAYEGKLISPYELRYKALSQKLEAKDLARVILHIAKHRGYMKKNQKNSNDSDKGKVLDALRKNDSKLKEYQNVGEYLYINFFEKYREGTKKFQKCTQSRNKR